MTYSDLILHLRTLADTTNADGMRRFGIRPQTELLGISVKTLRGIAKPYKRDHDLALKLWDSGIHEARIIASIIANPKQMSPDEMNRWAESFDSWDICDQCCTNLFIKTPFAYLKAVEWSTAEAEFVKRAGFVMMADLAVHDKRAEDSVFSQFLLIITREAGDDRNFVKKAINWALRGIGKRNHGLNQLAIVTAQALTEAEGKAARWIGKDALRELTSDSVQKRLKQ